MPGPILSRILSNDEEEQQSESILLRNHRERLLEQMDRAGGCCGATEVAESVRTDGQEYR